MATIGLTSGVPNFTGAQKMGYYWARAFLNAGDRVVAVCGKAPAKDFGGADEYPSVIEHFEKIGVEVTHEDGFRNPWDRKLITRVADWLKANEVDCLVSTQQIELKIAGWAALKARVPYVFNAQGPPKFAGGGVMQWAKTKAFGFTLRRCSDEIIYTSQAMLDHFRQHFHVKTDNARILPNGVEIGEPIAFGPGERDAVRAEFGVTPDQLMLTNVGRLDPQKGQHILLEALHHCGFDASKVKLVLVGNITSSRETVAQSYYDQLKEMEAKWGLKDGLVFAGWRNDVNRVLAASDIYVHSAMWEGPALPLALVEAMAAKLPAILTDCSGHPEGFVNGEQGYVVPMGQAKPLAEAMQTVVGLPADQQAAMGAAARELATTRYDINVIGERFVKMIHEVIDRRKAGTSG